MSTVSVPLTAHLEDHLKNLVRCGYAPTKAEVLRRALTRLIEDEAVYAVLQAEQEIREGKIVKGNLHKILKTLP